MEIIFYIPTAILLIIWILIRKWKLRKIHLIIVWIISVSTLCAYGWFTHEENYECTQIASSLFLASTIYLNGPVLIYFSDKRKKHFIIDLIIGLGCIPLGMLSFIITFIALGVFDQVWGM
tara:strand:+ start:1464 stop:1823 length:360 start_codon:yes stop_codon:yes gene_type:complete